jgi:hypothetical protein
VDENIENIKTKIYNALLVDASKNFRNQYEKDGYKDRYNEEIYTVEKLQKYSYDVDHIIEKQQISKILVEIIHSNKNKISQVNGYFIERLKRIINNYYNYNLTETKLNNTKGVATKDYLKGNDGLKNSYSDKFKDTRIIDNIIVFQKETVKKIITIIEREIEMIKFYQNNKNDRNKINKRVENIKKTLNSEVEKNIIGYVKSLNDLHNEIKDITYNINKLESCASKEQFNKIKEIYNHNFNNASNSSLFNSYFKSESKKNDAKQFGIYWKNITNKEGYQIEIDSILWNDLKEKLNERFINEPNCDKYIKQIKNFEI